MSQPVGKRRLRRLTKRPKEKNASSFGIGPNIGLLRVQIFEAKHLRKQFGPGRNPTYVTVQCESNPIFQTKLNREEINPVFHESTQFHIKNRLSKIKIVVRGKSKLNDANLGSISIPLRDIVNASECTTLSTRPLDLWYDSTDKPEPKSAAELSFSTSDSSSVSGESPMLAQSAPVYRSSRVTSNGTKSAASLLKKPESQMLESTGVKNETADLHAELRKLGYATVSLTQWYTLRGKDREQVAGLIRVGMEYTYSPVCDFISSISEDSVSSADALMGSGKCSVPEPAHSIEDTEDDDAAANPDGYFAALKFCRASAIRFLYAILPLLRVIVFLKYVLSWRNKSLSLLFLVTFVWVVYHEVFISALCFLLFGVLLYNYITNVQRMMSGEDTGHVRFQAMLKNDESNHAVMLEVANEVESVMFVLRGYKRAGPIYELMGKIAAAFNRASTLILSVRQHTLRPDARIGKRVLQASLALFFLSLYVPVFPMLVFVFRWCLLAGGVYALTIGSLYRVFPSTRSQFPLLLRFVVLHIRQDISYLIACARYLIHGRKGNPPSKKTTTVVKRSNKEPETAPAFQRALSTPTSCPVFSSTDKKSRSNDRGEKTSFPFSSAAAGMAMSTRSFSEEQDSSSRVLKGLKDNKNVPSGGVEPPATQQEPRSSEQVSRSQVEEDMKKEDRKEEGSGLSSSNSSLRQSIQASPKSFEDLISSAASRVVQSAPKGTFSRLSDGKKRLSCTIKSPKTRLQAVLSNNHNSSDKLEGDKSKKSIPFSEQLASLDEQTMDGESDYQPSPVSGTSPVGTLKSPVLSSGDEWIEMEHPKSLVREGDLPDRSGESHSNSGSFIEKSPFDRIRERLNQIPDPLEKIRLAREEEKRLRDSLKIRCIDVIPLSIQHGYLWKQPKKAKKIRSWQKRYWVLCSGSLYCYLSNRDTQAYEVMDPKEITVAKTHDLANTAHPHTFAIHNNSNNRQYILAADSEAERDGWLTKLQEESEK